MARAEHDEHNKYMKKSEELKTLERQRRLDKALKDLNIRQATQQSEGSKEGAVGRSDESTLPSREEIINVMQRLSEERDIERATQLSLANQQKEEGAVGGVDMGATLSEEEQMSLAIQLSLLEVQKKSPMEQEVSNPTHQSGSGSSMLTLVDDPRTGAISKTGNRR